MQKHLNNFDKRHCYFSLKEGMYQATFFDHELCLDQELSRQFNALSKCSLSNFENLSLNPGQRKALLHKIIDYYRFHLEGLKEIKSHHVLESVLH